MPPSLEARTRNLIARFADDSSAFGVAPALNAEHLGVREGSPTHARTAADEPTGSEVRLARRFETSLHRCVADALSSKTITCYKENGALAADIDLDESSGVEHGFEVIHNAVFRSRTNPFLIHEFLLSADPVGKSLDAGYTFRL